LHESELIRYDFNSHSLNNPNLSHAYNEPLLFGSVPQWSGRLWETNSDSTEPRYFASLPIGTIVWFVTSYMCLNTIIPRQCRFGFLLHCSGCVTVSRTVDTSSSFVLTTALGKRGRRNQRVRPRLLKEALGCIGCITSVNLESDNTWSWWRICNVSTPNNWNTLKQEHWLTARIVPRVDSSLNILWCSFFMIRLVTGVDPLSKSISFLNPSLERDSNGEMDWCRWPSASVVQVDLLGNTCTK
jgi:hypothetical protein